MGKAKKWFGEDGGKMPVDFRELIRGASVNKSSADRIAEGLWRRHGMRAHDIVQSRSEPLEEVFEGLGISYSEVSHVIRAEMVVSADDLLRRRLPIAMTRSAADIFANTKLQDVLRRENLV
jgi:glycerol-3-phosphate dehydrogenase